MQNIYLFIRLFIRLFINFVGVLRRTPKLLTYTTAASVRLGNKTVMPATARAKTDDNAQAVDRPSLYMPRLAKYH